MKAHVIHADLSEYNIILKPDGHILIIDWPQYVTADHANAEELLERDLKTCLLFSDRKFNVKVAIEGSLRLCDWENQKFGFLMLVGV